VYTATCISTNSISHPNPYPSDFQPGFRGAQGFRERLPRFPQLACSENDLACEITPDNVVEILSIDFLFKIAFLRIFFAQTYCVESFLLLIKFWQFAF